MKKYLIAAIIVCLSILSVLMIGCSPINSINKDISKMTKGNYTLSVHEENLQGAAEFERKYANDNLYLFYEDKYEIYYEGLSGFRINEYILVDGKWVVTEKTHDEIDFSMPNNYAYAAMILAMDDLQKYFDINKKIYTLKDDYYNSVFDVPYAKAYIFRRDGMTVVRADLSTGKFDEIMIYNVGRTKIKLPAVL